jgi:peptidoglycan/LPS O-acetylase OafA/YrhL
MVLEFAAGMALAHASHALRPQTASFLLAIGFIALLTLPQAGPWRCLVWGLPAAAMLAASISLEPSFGPRMPASLLAVGDASFAIYLVHPFVVPALAPHGVVLAALAVPASIAAGLLVHRLIDAPLQRRLAGPRRPQPAYAEAASGAGVLSL